LATHQFSLWRGSGRHAERRPFPFAPLHLGCKHTRRCSRLLTGRTRFDSWASYFLRSCSPTANAPLRGASGYAGWTFGFHVRGSATPRQRASGAAPLLFSTLLILHLAT